jgi:hypothetical protein
LTIAFWLQLHREWGANPRIVHPWIALNFESSQGVGVLGQVVDPAKPKRGEWHHFAISIDQERHWATIYRDGVEVASGKMDASRDKGVWVFGHNQDSRNHQDSFVGILDDVRVYRRLLTPDEAVLLAGAVP